MASGYSFDEQSIRRIIRSVLVTERRDRSRPVRGKRPRNYPPGVGEGGGFDRCKASAKGAFTEATSVITVDNVIAEKGPNPTENLADELQVRNRYGYKGADNDLMTIAFDQSIPTGSPTPQWYLLQKGC